MPQRGKCRLPAGSGLASRAETTPWDPGARDPPPAQQLLPTLAPLGKILESVRPCSCEQRLVHDLILLEAQTSDQADLPSVPLLKRCVCVGVPGSKGTDPLMLQPWASDLRCAAAPNLFPHSAGPAPCRKVAEAQARNRRGPPTAEPGRTPKGGVSLPYHLCLLY